MVVGDELIICPGLRYDVENSVGYCEPDLFGLRHGDKIHPKYSRHSTMNALLC